MPTSSLRAPASPLPGRTRAAVSRLLARLGVREPAPSAATWDAQYAAGRWAYLGELPELVQGYRAAFITAGAKVLVRSGVKMPPGSFRMTR